MSPSWGETFVELAIYYAMSQFVILNQVVVLASEVRHKNIRCLILISYHILPSDLVTHKLFQMMETLSFSQVLRQMWRAVKLIPEKVPLFLRAPCVLLYFQPCYKALVMQVRRRIVSQKKRMNAFLITKLCTVYLLGYSGCRNIKYRCFAAATVSNGPNNLRRQ